MRLSKGLRRREFLLWVILACFGWLFPQRPRTLSQMLRETKTPLR